MLKEIVILALLESGPRHGYEIKKELEFIVGNREFLNNNQLYPILHRFADEGIVERASDQGAQAHRILYTITDSGRRYFQTAIRDFGDAEAGDENEFFARVAMFDKVDSEDRRWILKVRRRRLEERLRKGEEHLRTYFVEPPAERDWAMEIVKFRNMRLKGEIEWIDELIEEA